MEIIKDNNEQMSTITICDNNQEFKMMYGGNGDLYWELYNQDHPFIDEAYFTITKENYPLYQAFERLYTRVEECDIYSIDPLEIELCHTPEEIAEVRKKTAALNEAVKRSSQYSKLYSQGGITFVSDEDIPFNKNNIVTIVKSYDENSFIIEFTKNSSERDFLDIRFRTSGSRYQDFIHLFLELYNTLSQADYDYHQIHIEEILYQKTLNKKLSNN